MKFTEAEAHDLQVFMLGLPARARDDEHAVRVFAELFADLHHLPESHVLRRIAERQALQ
jgi:hypothetical protein